MPSFIRNTSGGKAISGGALAPRSRRGNAVAQIDSYWRGGSTGPDATGGIGAPVSTGLGYNYLQFNATGNLTVTTAGTFEFKIFGGGGGGGGGNGYNAFGYGGAKGGTGNITAVLTPGTYLITIGAGGTGAQYPYGYSGTNGTSSSVAGYTAGSEIGSGGAQNGNTPGTNANGATGTEVNTFIGGSSLFKAAGGGNSITGIGGSGIGGNGSNGAPGAATSAAANTASGGGGAGGSGLPDLFTGYGGNGGTGIVYVRWLA
jgi:hypothetical protein